MAYDYPESYYRDQADLVDGRMTPPCSDDDESLSETSTLVGDDDEEGSNEDSVEDKSGNNDKNNDEDDDQDNDEDSEEDNDEDYSFLVYRTALKREKINPVRLPGESRAAHIRRVVASPDCCLYHMVYDNPYGSRAARNAILRRYRYKQTRESARRVSEREGSTDRTAGRYRMRRGSSVRDCIDWRWTQYKMAVDCANAWRRVDRSWVWSPRESDCHWRCEQAALRMRKDLGKRGR